MADELISRNELLSLYGNDDSLRVSVGVVKQNILDMSTIEPKHGWWIRTGEDGYCSECGCDMPMFKNDWEWEYTETDYCPNCGADMRESTMGQVKHGHWVKYGSPLFSEWECSECGERHTGDNLPDKCPHCKARMDEVE